MATVRPALEVPVVRRRGRQKGQKVEYAAPRPLTEVPQDYEPSKHIRLSRKDFNSEATFFKFKAAMAQRLADKYNRLAAEAEHYGTAAERKAAKKLATLQKRIAELQAELQAKGIDVSALIGNVS